MSTSRGNVSSFFYNTAVLILGFGLLQACGGGGGGQDDGGTPIITSNPLPPSTNFTIGNASSAALSWSKTYGGSDYESGFVIQTTTEGGYIVAGISSSSGEGSSDILLIKFNADGSVAWRKTYGGVSTEYAFSLQVTASGGYLIGGYTTSFGRGANDALVINVDSNGNILWSKAYGGADDDRFLAVAPTSDGGFIFTGYTDASGGLNADVMVVKMDSSGTILWQQTYSTSRNDKTYAIQATTDGGYIVAGSSIRPGLGLEEPWVMKLDSAGAIEWQNVYTISQEDYINSIEQTADGGFILAIANHPTVLKLNADGMIAWQKQYSLFNNTRILSVRSNTNGGYLVAGHTYVGSNRDGLILNLNDDGTIASQQTYGASDDSRDIDSFYTALSIPDGGFVALGDTQSAGGGFFDLWIVKQDPTTALTFNPISRMHSANGKETASPGKASRIATAVVAATSSFSALDVNVIAHDATRHLQTQTAGTGVGQPGGFQATPGVLTGEIYLTWNITGSGADGIILYSSSDNVTFVRDYTIPYQSWYQFPESRLTPGNTYYYKFVAVNESGYSEFSKTVSAIAPSIF